MVMVPVIDTKEYSIERATYDRLVSNFEEYYLKDKVRKCPKCGDGIDPVYRISVQNNLDLVVVYRCPVCDELIVAKYKEKHDLEEYQSLGFELVEIHPKGNHLAKQFSEEIKEVSSRFCRVYGQAEKAYNDNLDEICGAGFRKALEILIKDYLINDDCKKATEALDKLKLEVNALDEQDKADKLKKIGKNTPVAKYINGSGITVKDVVLKSKLDKCIEYCVSDPNILECAHQARYIGNDETHYDSKLDDATTEDLKLLIDLTVNWIKTEKLTERYKNRFYQR